MSVVAVILAAGEGKRMKSDLPKVLHEAAGEPLLASTREICTPSIGSPVALSNSLPKGSIRTIVTERSGPSCSSR